MHPAIARILGLCCNNGGHRANFGRILIPALAAFQRHARLALESSNRSTIAPLHTSVSKAGRFFVRIVALAVGVSVKSLTRIPHTEHQQHSARILRHHRGLTGPQLGHEQAIPKGRSPWGTEPPDRLSQPVTPISSSPETQSSSVKRNRSAILKPVAWRRSRLRRGQSC
jgi:hypothetical protein